MRKRPSKNELTAENQDSNSVKETLRSNPQITNQPNHPQLKPGSSKKLTPEENEALARASQRMVDIQRRLQAELIVRQNWQNDPNSMRRVASTLARDPVLRNTLFRMAKGSDIPFVMLHPRQQLQVVQQVQRQLQMIAIQILNQQNANQVNPLDPTHPLNQANPMNLTNQWQAVMAGIVLNENNLAEAENAFESNTHFNQMHLSEAEQNEVTENNQNEFAPQPEYSESKRDDEEDHEKSLATKTLEHVGEEKALEGLMNLDKEQMLGGFKGESLAKEAIKHELVKDATKMALTMAKL